jgi:D-tagatose-1,6-bisphosphate aldolase subunit GatZ/KbaZ
VRQNILKKIVMLQKIGIPIGAYSICSANKFVIKAGIKKASNSNNGSFVIIESTSNQVNQFGGYTGMNPVDFKEFVYSIANNIDFPLNKIILGGDHLGPNPWKNERPEIALKRAAEMIKQYVEAGYVKIHIDASMPLGDEETISNQLVAQRTSELCFIAEKAYHEAKKQNTCPPMYIIGSEVPIPGGDNDFNGEIKITKVQNLEDTIFMNESAFKEKGLEEAWKRVFAVVVQPGVEFGDDKVVEYDNNKTKELQRKIKKYNNIIFETHSTDYQKPSSLKKLVKDGFAILKVGPALTYAMREGLFLLEQIEKELYKNNRTKLSNLSTVIEDEMKNNPVNWKNYYSSEGKELQFELKYSFYDRMRYYWQVPSVKKAVDTLINNLNNRELPLSIISQYFPIQYKKIREGVIKNTPEDLILDKIINVLDDYSYAVNTS